MSCICTYAVSAYPQFYYTVPPPPQPAPASMYYSTSFGTNSPFPFQPPTMSYVSRSFGPSQAYYTTHQTFGSLAGGAPPIQYQTFTGNTPNDVQTIHSGFQQQTGSAFAQVPATTVYSTGPTDQYRGFAYHTQSTNGGSANVFFLTGPEAHQIRNLPAFSFTATQNGTESKTAEKAKTLASDTVDSNATDKNQQQQITETLAGPPQGPAFEAIRSFLENPQLGFHNFYAANGHLFSRPLQDNNLNFPANTVLLPNPISVQAFGNFPLQPRFGDIENATETNSTSESTTEKSEDKGEEVAESMIADVSLKPNSDTAESTATTADSASSTTEAVSEASSSTTTEASTKEETTTKDAPTVKEARSVKQEPTTKQAESSTKKEESSSEKTTETTKSPISESTTGSSSTTKNAQ